MTAIGMNSGVESSTATVMEETYVPGASSEGSTETDSVAGISPLRGDAITHFASDGSSTVYDALLAVARSETVLGSGNFEPFCQTYESVTFDPLSLMIPCEFWAIRPAPAIRIVTMRLRM